MERIRNASRAIHREYRRTIEWRSPLTGLYLMVVNSAFWVGVIYGDPKIQEALLATSSACIFAWDILFSSTNNRSIITHILIWPFQSIFRTISVGGSLYSAYLIRSQEIRMACYSAYATLACLLINPVWEYYDINLKIANSCKKTARSVGDWIHYLFVNPILVIYGYIKYIVLFQWVAPLFAYIKHFIFNFRTACRELVTGIRNWFSVQIVDRFKRGIQRIRAFLRYWFFAEWWPGFKDWVKINIGHPLRLAFDNICFCFVYVFCAHWFPPFWRFLGRQMRNLAGLADFYIWQPTKIFLLQQFEKFRCWLRKTLHRLAIAIRDSIIWPVCLLVIDYTKILTAYLYGLILEPVLAYIYGRYKIVETQVLIYVLGPMCETVIEHIPEKNPFCDDSDVEFDGFLPEVQPETDFDEDLDDEDEGMESHQRSGVISSAASSISEEEFEFERGLRFSAINGSESSDEEFDLHKSRKTEKVLRKRKSAPVIAQDDEFEILE